MTVSIEPEAPGAESPGRGPTGEHGPSGEPAGEHASRPAGRRPEVESAAALATRRLCPYLMIDGGAWRSALPEHDHRCGAIAPMPLLTIDKQRRLCLTDRHLTCATFLAAKGLDAASEAGGSERAVVAVGPGRPAGTEAVTRWSIVRTTPVILDHSRIPVVGSLPRGRALGQLGLGILLVAAFVALAAGRLSGPSAPALVGEAASPSPTASAPLVAAGSPNQTAGPSPTSSPSSTPKPSKTPAPTPRPTPSPSTAPSQSTTYKVKNGDTLYGISIRFHTTVKAIQQLNDLTSTTLHIGQVLKIP